MDIKEFRRCVTCTKWGRVKKENWPKRGTDQPDRVTPAF